MTARKDEHFSPPHREGKIAGDNTNPMEQPQNKTSQQMDVSGSVALLKFLKEEQQQDYQKAIGVFDASIHQHYEEAIIAVLELIKSRFGN
jgi:hypothetical protein